MGLKPGYKQTEVGVIPEDWETSFMASIADVRDGTHASPKYHKNGVPLVTSKNIVDGRVDFHEITLISEEDAYEVNRRSRVDRDDILVSMIGTVGNVALVDFEPQFCIKNVALIKPYKSKVEPRFLAQLLRSSRYGRYIDGKLDGGIQKFISLGMLRSLIVPLGRTIAEQEDIAVALSDADALIESLEQLLAKKRNLKQGTMQELLRPKDGWVHKKLLNIAPLQRGFDLPNRQLENGRYPVVYSNGVLNHHKTFMVKGPGLVTGRSGTLGAVQFIEEDFWPHNTTLWVTDFKGNDPKFIYYFYTCIGLERFGTGSGVPTLNRNDVHDYSVSIPCDPKEQVFIATVLSDIDAEIATLETKLTKARQLKTGMMQELLTGRIRLV